MNYGVIPRRVSLLCRSCRQAGHRRIQTSSAYLTTSPLEPFTLRPRRVGSRPRKYATQAINSSLAKEFSEHNVETVSGPDLSKPSSVLERIRVDIMRICSASTVPEEQAVFRIMETSRQLAQVLVHGAMVNQSRAEAQDQIASNTATTSVLVLDELPSHVEKTPVHMSIPFRLRAASVLAENIRDLLCDPKVYITPDILQIYVRIQCMINKPEHIPEIFHLYAHKPIPRSSQPPSNASEPPQPPAIKYRRAFPWFPTNAIPVSLAEAALASTIAIKSLPLSLSVIETSIATRSFRISKTLRRASPTLGFLSMTPLFSYAIASYIATQWQNTYDPTIATWLFFGGIMAYVGTTSSLGMIARLTYNDQMLRVTWRTGTPLRDRWLREEERAAFDQLALSWGFRERWRWGEERGVDWEALREFCSRRGMILDKTEFLPGMK